MSSNAADDPSGESSDLFSRLVYQNEMLKVENENLKESLVEHAEEMRHIEQLKTENMELRRQNDRMTVELNEKNEQLNMQNNTSTQFSKIDTTLTAIVTQLKDKQEEIDLLKAKLSQQQKERDDELARNVDKAREQEVINAFLEKEKKYQAEIEELRKKQKELCDFIENQKHLAEEKERDLTATYEAKVKSIQDELNALVTSRAKRAEESASKATAAAAAPAVDWEQALQTEPELIQLVNDRVHHENRLIEERLKKQTEENAILISRMSLVQQESKNLIDKYLNAATNATPGSGTQEGRANAGDDTRQGNQLADRSFGLLQEHVAKKQNYKSAVHQKVANFFTAKEQAHRQQTAVAGAQNREEKLLFSKEDVEEVLSMILDYQEEYENENSTLLLIKDIQSEEREIQLNNEVKRLSNENITLQAALKASLRAGNDNARGFVSSSNAVPAPAAAPAAHHHPQGPPVAPTNNRANNTTTATGAANQPRSNNIMSDLFSNITPARVNPDNANKRPVSCAEAYPIRSNQPFDNNNNLGNQNNNMRNPQQMPPAASAVPVPQANQPNPAAYGMPMPLYPMSTGAPAPVPQHQQHQHQQGNDAMVSCPACTFRQPLSNRKCEMCEKVLEFH